MSDHTFTAERLRRLTEMEHWHFWFVGRRALIDRYLKRNLNGSRQLVLDLGCGSGYLLEKINRQGHSFVGLDLRPEGLLSTHQQAPSLWLIQADAAHIPLKDNVVDGVLMLDILEHVDDRAVLNEVHRTLKQGGWLVLTVPAIPWLFSYRDRAAGHLRRYTRTQLSQILQSVDLHPTAIRYYQFFLFPLVVFSRWLGRRKSTMRDLEEKHVPGMNQLFSWINRLEAKLGDFIAWPWGSSLFVMCRKEKL